MELRTVLPWFFRNLELRVKKSTQFPEPRFMTVQIRGWFFYESRKGKYYSFVLPGIRFIALL